MFSKNTNYDKLQNMYGLIPDDIITGLISQDNSFKCRFCENGFVNIYCNDKNEDLDYCRLGIEKWLKNYE